MRGREEGEKGGSRRQCTPDPANCNKNIMAPSDIHTSSHLKNCRARNI